VVRFPDADAGVPVRVVDDDVAAEAAQAVAPFQYGPNVNVTFSAYNDEFAKAAESKTRQAFLDAVAAMQQITVDDLESSGFTVAK